MKSVAGRLRLDLAQYRELEAFSAFGSDLDKASKAQLERGARLVELLKQPQYAPFSVERQVVSVWAGTTGQLDDVPVKDIRRFEKEFLDYVEHRHKGIYDAIVSSGQLSEETTQSLEQAIGDFKKTFDTSDGQSLVKDEKVDAMEAGEEGQEKVTAHRPQKPAEQQQG
jgi:F-type H+-transporting ATPase subunit alpha